MNFLSYVSAAAMYRNAENYDCGSELLQNLANISLRIPFDVANQSSFYPFFSDSFRFPLPWLVWNPPPFVGGHCGSSKPWTYVSVVLATLSPSLEPGASGCESWEPQYRANAIVLMARVVSSLVESVPAARVVSITGGDKHNSIPREAFATVLLPKGEGACCVDPRSCFYRGCRFKVESFLTIESCFDSRCWGLRFRGVGSRRFGEVYTQPRKEVHVNMRSQDCCDVVYLPPLASPLWECRVQELGGELVGCGRG